MTSRRSLHPIYLAARQAELPVMTNSTLLNPPYDTYRARIARSIHAANLTHLHSTPEIDCHDTREYSQCQLEYSQCQLLRDNTSSPNTTMNILVYKRTHNGDPDALGCFGVYDCMGTVRDREYDAVIGVGGIGPEARANGIAGIINWIGVGPHKRYVGKRGPEVTFDRFVYYGCDGPDFWANAPNLARRMYEHNVRSVLHGLTDEEMAEALAIVALADDAPPSPGLSEDDSGSQRLRQCKRDGRTIRCTGAREKPGC